MRVKRNQSHLSIDLCVLYWGYNAENRERGTEMALVT